MAVLLTSPCESATYLAIRHRQVKDLQPQNSEPARQVLQIELATQRSISPSLANISASGRETEKKRRHQETSVPATRGGESEGSSVSERDRKKQSQSHRSVNRDASCEACGGKHKKHTCSKRKPVVDRVADGVHGVDTDTGGGIGGDEGGQMEEDADEAVVIAAVAHKDGRAALRAEYRREVAARQKWLSKRPSESESAHCPPAGFLQRSLAVGRACKECRRRKIRAKLLRAKMP
ncbi:MAG: hypothetical protein ACPIOQ_44705 [Promethearchaeia archaeon]